MATLQVQLLSSITTVYALIRSASATIWNGSSFVTYATANLGTYDVPMTEQGTASKYYTVTFPGSIAAGVYEIAICNQAGGSPAEADLVVAKGTFDTNGHLQATDIVTSGAITTSSGAVSNVTLTATTTTNTDMLAATAIVSSGAINTTGGAVDNVTTVATTTTNTDMRGTDNASTGSLVISPLLASVDNTNITATVTISEGAGGPTIAWTLTDAAGAAVIPDGTIRLVIFRKDETVIIQVDSTDGSPIISSTSNVVTISNITTLSATTGDNKYELWNIKVAATMLDTLLAKGAWNVTPTVKGS